MLIEGRYHEALLLSQKSIDLDENDAEAYMVKSEALGQLNRLEEALEACKQAERHEFYEPRGRSHLLGLKAIVLYFLRDLEGALATYNERLAIDPLCVLVALPQKATVLRDLGRYSEMVTTLSPALDWKVKNVEVYELLVEALCHLERFDEAIPHLSEIICLEPDNVKAYEMLAFLSLCTGRLKEALEMGEQAIKLGPTQPVITYWTIGKALYHFGRYEEALDAYQRVLTYPSDSSFSDKAREGIEEIRRKLDDTE